MNSVKPRFLVYLVVVIAIAVAGFLYWYLGKDRVDTEYKKIETTEEAVEILSQTPEATIETNPVKKVPDLNPVEKVNPFKIPNPFE